MGVVCGGVRASDRWGVGVLVLDVCVRAAAGGRVGGVGSAMRRRKARHKLEQALEVENPEAELRTDWRAWRRIRRLLVRPRRR